MSSDQTGVGQIERKSAVGDLKYQNGVYKRLVYCSMMK
jgi:hypothetical protein